MLDNRLCLHDVMHEMEHRNFVVILIYPVRAYDWFKGNRAELSMTNAIGALRSRDRHCHLK